jgi:hypothetical protein
LAWKLIVWTDITFLSFPELTIMAKLNTVDLTIINDTDVTLTFGGGWFEAGRLADGHVWPGTIPADETVNISCCERAWSLAGCAGGALYYAGEVPLYFFFSNPAIGYNGIEIGTDASMRREMSRYRGSAVKRMLDLQDGGRWMIAEIKCRGGAEKRDCWEFRVCDTNTIQPANLELSDVAKVFASISPEGMRQHFQRAGGWAGFSGPWRHQGGVQACGSFIAMGTQQSAAGQASSSIQVFDARLAQVDGPLRLIGEIARPGLGIDGVAMTREAGKDGRYIIAGVSERKLAIYCSPGASLLSSDAAAEFTEVFNYPNFAEAGAQLALVTQKDGAIYLISMTGRASGADHKMCLYRMYFGARPAMVKLAEICGLAEIVNADRSTNGPNRWGPGLEVASLDWHPV